MIWAGVGLRMLTLETLSEGHDGRQRQGKARLALEHIV